MLKKSLKENTFMMTLRVLGYKQPDGQWAAHCLETDLVGYGKTFNKALSTLVELTEMQISFAVFKNQPALLERPAPLSIIEGYNSLYSQNLRHYTLKKKPKVQNRKVASFALPPLPSKAESCFVSA